MNPVLDITTSVDTVRPSEKLRCETTRYDPGGGINVVGVARVLGESVSAVFPAGGPTGDLVISLLNDAGVPFRQVAITASTRESFTVNENSSGQQYRFVLPGPRLTFTEQARCLDQLRMAAESAEFVVAPSRCSCETDTVSLPTLPMLAAKITPMMIACTMLPRKNETIAVAVNKMSTALRS